MKESPFWNVAVPRVLSSYAVATFAILWGGFGMALLVNREWLDLLWSWLKGLPSLAEVIIWVVFLPIPVGLSIWHSSWEVLPRLLAWAGLVGWTLLAASSLARAFRSA